MVVERPSRLVEAVVEGIRRRGLAAPALLFLEAHRPYVPLATHLSTFMRPILRPALGGGADELTRILESDGELEAAIGRLKQADEVDSRA